MTYGDVGINLAYYSNKEEQCGCMVPVNLLADHNVKALIVGGIGMRHLMGFKQIGIDVYHDDQKSKIKPVVEDLLTGHCGHKAYQTLDAVGIKVVNDVMGTVRSAVKEFDYDKATFATDPDVEPYS